MALAVDPPQGTRGGQPRKITVDDIVSLISEIQQLPAPASHAHPPSRRRQQRSTNQHSGAQNTQATRAVSNWNDSSRRPSSDVYRQINRESERNSVGTSSTSSPPGSAGPRPGWKSSAQPHEYPTQSQVFNRNEPAGSNSRPLSPSQTSSNSNANRRQHRRNNSQVATHPNRRSSTIGTSDGPPLVDPATTHPIDKLAAMRPYAMVLQAATPREAEAKQQESTQDAARAGQSRFQSRSQPQSQSRPPPYVTPAPNPVPTTSYHGSQVAQTVRIPATGHTTVHTAAVSKAETQQQGAIQDATRVVQPQSPPPPPRSSNPIPTTSYRGHQAEQIARVPVAAHATCTIPSPQANITPPSSSRPSPTTLTRLPTVTSPIANPRGVFSYHGYQAGPKVRGPAAGHATAHAATAQVGLSQSTLHPTPSNSTPTSSHYGGHTEQTVRRPTAEQTTIRAAAAREAETRQQVVHNAVRVTQPQPQSLPHLIPSSDSVPTSSSHRVQQAEQTTRVPLERQIATPPANSRSSLNHPPLVEPAIRVPTSSIIANTSNASASDDDDLVGDADSVRAVTGGYTRPTPTREQVHSRLPTAPQSHPQPEPQPAPPPRRSANRPCSICLDIPDEFPRQRPTSRCTHAPTVCAPCLEQHISYAVQSQGSTTPTCPNPGCRRAMQYVDVVRGARKNRVCLDRYEALLLRRTLEKEPNFRWCKSSTCNWGQVHEGGAAAPIVICQACRARSCFTHDVPWHTGLTCQQYTAQRANRTVEDQASQAYIARHAKICPGPRCGRRIQKDEGCDHMTCRRPGGCGHEFCWVCLAAYDPIRREGNHRHNPTCRYYAAIASTPLRVNNYPRTYGGAQPIQHNQLARANPPPRRSRAGGICTIIVILLWICISFAQSK